MRSWAGTTGVLTDADAGDAGSAGLATVAVLLIAVAVVAGFTCTTRVNVTVPTATSGWVNVTVPVPPTAGAVTVHPAGGVAETKVVLAGDRIGDHRLRRRAGPGVGDRQGVGELLPGHDRIRAGGLGDRHTGAGPGGDDGRRLRAVRARVAVTQGREGLPGGGAQEGHLRLIGNDRVAGHAGVDAHAEAERPARPGRGLPAGRGVGAVAEPDPHRRAGEFRLVVAGAVGLDPDIHPAEGGQGPGLVRRVGGNRIVQHHVDGRVIAGIGDREHILEHIPRLDRPPVDVGDGLRHLGDGLEDVVREGQHAGVVLLFVRRERQRRVLRPVGENPTGVDAVDIKPEQVGKDRGSGFSRWCPARRWCC